MCVTISGLASPLSHIKAALGICKLCELVSGPLLSNCMDMFDVFVSCGSLMFALHWFAIIDRSDYQEFLGLSVHSLGLG